MQDKSKNLSGMILVKFALRVVELNFLPHYDLQSKKIAIWLGDEGTKLLTTLLLKLVILSLTNIISLAVDKKDFVLQNIFCHFPPALRG